MGWIEDVIINEIDTREEGDAYESFTFVCEKSIQTTATAIKEELIKRLPKKKELPIIQISELTGERGEVWEEWRMGYNQAIDEITKILND